ncbi:formylglycine-generating enzyme [Azospirillaceae bacterium]
MIMDYPYALPRGRQFEDVEILESLGQGALGITYLALDHRLGRRVCLKEYYPRVWTTREGDALRPRDGNAAIVYQAGLESFLKEGAILTNLNHRAVVRTLRGVEANGTAYWVQSLIIGQSLRSHIRSLERRLTEFEIDALLFDLLDGLKHIHENDFLHRDITPDNILIQKNSAPIFIDFGLSRTAIGVHCNDMTAATSSGYSPIEQHHLHSRLGPWSDIYALGGVLHWAISREAPIDSIQRAEAVLNQNGRDPRQKLTFLRVPGYRRRLLEAVDWAMEMRAVDRPQSAAALSERLGHPDSEVDPDFSTTAPSRRIETTNAKDHYDGAASFRLHELHGQQKRPLQVAVEMLLEAQRQQESRQKEESRQIENFENRLQQELQNQKEEALKEVEQRAWSNARRAHALEGYLGYLTLFPEGRNKEDAQRAADMLKETLRNQDEAERQVRVKAEERKIQDESARCVDEALSTMENRVWDNVQHAGSFEAYAGYITLFGEGRHRHQAQTALNALREARRQSEQAIEQAAVVDVARREATAISILEDAAWTRAQNDGSLEAYQGYLIFFPEGRYRDPASLAVNDRRTAALQKQKAEKEAEKRAFEEAEKRRIQETAKRVAHAALSTEDATWARAQRNGSLEAYQGYLILFPEGRYREPASVAVNDRRTALLRKQEAEKEAEKRAFEEAEKRRTQETAKHVAQAALSTEDAAWTRAQNDGSLEAYQGYLILFPEGRYREPASLAVNDRRAALLQKQEAEKEAEKRAFEEAEKRRTQETAKQTAVASLFTEDAAWENARTETNRAQQPAQKMQEPRMEEKVSKETPGEPIPDPRPTSRPTTEATENETPSPFEAEVLAEHHLDRSRYVKKKPWTGIAAGLIGAIFLGIGGFLYFQKPLDQEHPSPNSAFKESSSLMQEEIEAWNELQNTQQVSVFDAFLQKFPNSRFLDDVKVLRARLMAAQAANVVTEEERRRRTIEMTRAAEETAWQTVKISQQSVDVMVFLKDYPDGAHAEDAKMLMTRLVNEEERKQQAIRETQAAEAARQAEDASWKTAIDEGRIAGFEAYLNDYPSGVYIKEAKENLFRRDAASVMISGVVFRDCQDKKEDFLCPEMVVAPSGTFLMGSSRSEKERDNDETPHSVTIGYSFAVGKYEVTFHEWDVCVENEGCGGYRPSDEKWGRGRRPVINVSWDDAQSYVQWLSKKTNRNYRLLTEAEWEYVAKAKTTTRYYWGDDINHDQQCQYANGGDLSGVKTKGWDPAANAKCDDGYVETAPVGSFQPNGFGLHDILGNVWEWVEDCKTDYKSTPTDGHAYTSKDCKRLLRGGSWLNLPRNMRASLRLSVPAASNRYNNLGFRVARTLSPTP